MPHTFQNEMEVAARFARAGGAVLMDVYKGDFSVEYKGDASTKSDPVTIADKRANDLIVEALRKEFPRDAIVAEESDNQPENWAGNQRIWYVDPLDGTREFVDRIGEFSVMIGLAVGGEAKVGAVYWPTRDELYLGVVGEGAWIERAAEGRMKAQLSKRSSLSESRLIYTRSRKSEKTAAFEKAISPASVINSGSVGCKVAHVLADRADVYFEVSAGARAWDTCGPEAILRAAGGELTDLHGRRLKYGQAELRALFGLAGSNGLLHSALIEKVSPLFST